MVLTQDPMYAKCHIFGVVSIECVPNTRRLHTHQHPKHMHPKTSITKYHHYHVANSSSCTPILHLHAHQYVAATNAFFGCFFFSLPAIPFPRWGDSYFSVHTCTVSPAVHLLLQDQLPQKSGHLVSWSVRLF